MLRPFLILSLLAAPARADYSVRLVTIRVPELAALRVCLNYPPAGSEELRNECLPYFTAPVCDMLVRCAEGTAKAEATAEPPYPTEFNPLPRFDGRAMPSSFATRNCGYSAELRIFADPATSAAFARIDWQQMHHLGFVRFPLIAAAGRHSVIQPRFLSSTVSTVIPAGSSRWQLLGMAQPIAAIADPVAVPPVSLMTFARVTGTATGPPQSPAPAAPGRIHLVTFRTAAAEAPALAMRPKRNDSALLESFMKRAESGEVTLAGYDTCLMPPRRDIRPSPPAPISADPFADAPAPAPDPMAGLTKSSSSSLLEYPWATERDPDPRAFATRNTGRTLTLSGPDLQWGYVDPFPALIPRGPASSSTDISDPEFTTEALDIQYSLASGETRLAGIHLLPAGDGPRMMDVHFLRSAGSGAGSPLHHREVHCALYSLEYSAAEHIRSLPPNRQVSEIERLANANQAQIIGWQCLPVEKGASAKAQRFSEVPSAAGSNVQRYDTLCLPVGIALHTLGETLSLSLGDDGSHIRGKFEVDLARPSGFSAAGLDSAASSGKKLPEFVPVKLTVEINSGRNSGAAGTPEVTFPVTPALPADHAEAGRCHAAVVYVR